MRYLAKKIYPLMVIIFLSGLIFSSCKKNGSKPNPPNNNKGTTHSDEDSLKWYIYQYMQVTITTDTTFKIPVYLWYNQVPYLNPFNTQYTSGENFLTTITGYPKNPSDRYSFLDRTGAVSGQIQGGQVGDLGIDINWAADANRNTHLYVLFAYKNSSAGTQGVQRGWQITAINGNSNVSYDGPGYGSGNSTNLNRVEDAIYNASSTQVTFKKPGGSTVTLTLTKTTYVLNPVLFDTVYTTANKKKVGYFVFNSFVSVYDTAGKPSETRNELDKIFSQFKSAAINDLVVDLRYNGGGSVGTAEYIDSLIAPASAAGKPMYTYSYNDKMTRYEDSTQLNLPITVNFPAITGGLSLDHVFFIVDRNTVSASELTLNNLKPYMDVKLIGDTTYGKPVGFFTFPIDLWDTVSHVQNRHLADLYPISFHTVNASGSGNYYRGIPPDIIEYDYIDLNWGDTTDVRLKEALKYVENGAFRLSNARMAVPVNGGQGIERITTRPGFNGMIDFRSSKAIRNRLAPLMRKRAG